MELRFDKAPIREGLREGGEGKHLGHSASAAVVPEHRFRRTTSGPRTCKRCDFPGASAMRS